MLEFRATQFNDTLKLDVDRVFRESPGGAFHAYRGPSDPHLSTLTWTMDHMTLEQVNAVIDFLEANLGRPFVLIDAYNGGWSVTVANPSAPITKLGKCHYSMTLEFVGSRLGENNT